MALSYSQWKMGSSPRMRGALPTAAYFRIHARIIPADAGSTVVKVGSALRVGDHPRGCGEHDARHCKPPTLMGSSPRMRGARNLLVLNRHLLGIIPADAGSTDSVSVGAAVSRDHPRGCGEHRVALFAPKRYEGSSPRMRGARPGGMRSYEQDRIIPADAGSTRCWFARVRCTRDHPRGCGEHRVHGHQSHGMQGSSPRMRGART